MKTSEWALIQHDQYPYKKKLKQKETPDTRACRGTTVGKTQGEDGHLQAKERGLRRN